MTGVMISRLGLDAPASFHIGDGRIRMIDQLRRMFAHMRWADERALEALRGAPRAPEKALTVYAHVLGAENVWMARLRQQPESVAVWPKLDLDQCAALAAENADAYDAFLSELSENDLERLVAYRNSKGEPFETRIDDILIHVALHGSYHRGQVAMMVRESGAEPLPTDYIAFVRGVPAATRD